MFGLFKRKKKVDLRDYLKKEKEVIIDGVIFIIKKIDLEDHLAGLNVIMKTRALYEKEKPSIEDAISHRKRINKIMRDIIFAGVVKPKLTMKKDEPEKIHVDEIIADQGLADKLAGEILGHTYGKKK